MQQVEEIREHLFDDVMDLVNEGIDELTKDRNICSGDFSEAILTVGQANRMKRRLRDGIAQTFATLRYKDLYRKRAYGVVPRT